jgi:hypothetical protein
LLILERATGALTELWLFWRLCFLGRCPFGCPLAFRLLFGRELVLEGVVLLFTLNCMNLKFMNFKGETWISIRGATSPRVWCLFNVDTVDSQRL